MELEYLFAAIALPCLAFAFADYLSYFLRNWKKAGEHETDSEWKIRKDDSEYDDFKEYW
jgi:hypothetical protein